MNILHKFVGTKPSIVNTKSVRLILQQQSFYVYTIFIHLDLLLQCSFLYAKFERIHKSIKNKLLLISITQQRTLLLLFAIQTLNKETEIDFQMTANELYPTLS